MTKAPTNFSLLLVFSITICLWMGCGSSEMKDFSLDTIEAQSEARLKILADTSITLPQIAQYSATQKQLDSLLYYAEWVKDYKEDISLVYAQMGYDLATEENLNFPRGVSAYQIALIKSRKSFYEEDIEDALVDARISERLLKEFNRLDWQIHIHNLLGVLSQQKGAYDLAQDNFDQALKKIENSKTSKQIVNKNKAKVLQNLGINYYFQGAVPEAALYFTQCDSLLHSFPANEEDFVSLWNDWALVHQAEKNYHQADSLYNLCINFYEGNQENFLLSRVYQSRGYMYSYQLHETGDFQYFDKTIATFKKSLEYEKEIKYFIYQMIGAAFHYMSNNEILKPNIDSAAYYYKLAIINAREKGAESNLKSASANLTILCAKPKEINCETILGDAALIFINTNYSALLDTITTHSKSAFQRINKVEQRDIRVNAANTRKNQLYIGLGILGAIGAIFLVLLQGQQNRRLKAEMEALRAQINPHFISNSLNAIESLVNLGNAKAAAKYLVHFSRLSRQILNGSRTATTSLSEELKTLQHFLALEQLRFRDKLTYETAVAEDINQDLVLVPAMILQPYVENAIWHGIKPKQTGGKVLIQVQKVGKKLRCIVEDNGIGRAAAYKMQKASVLQHKSMGMQITEERLKGMGRIKGSQIKIEDLMDELGEPCGTRVILQFPYKLKKN